jgi:alpha-L-rhamnosidase
VITVKYGEKLNDDGSLSMKGTDEHFRYPASFGTLPGGWFQTDRFVCDGSRSQVYEPRFTYNGFQYVQISGLKRAPDAASIEACVIHTDFKDAGSFSCSNELLNKLQQTILWAYRGNFVNGYPTDCPHREKNGWTGDASLASELAMYNFQNTAAYEKWVQDLIDEQRADGNLPGIVPTSGWGYQWGNGPAWDSALVIIPWMLYIYQGDTRALETAYPAMAKYVDYMTSRSKDGIVSHGLGDWIPVKTKTPVEVTSTGYYYLDAQIVARAAEQLGKTADAQKYAALARSIRDAYTRHLYKGNGVYSIGSQTAQSCALHQGLVPDAERFAVETRLVEPCSRPAPSRTSASGLEVCIPCTERCRPHRSLAFAMATKDEYPSYGNWIRPGATTFWESWKTESGSYNHIMFWRHLRLVLPISLGGIRLPDSVSAIARHRRSASCGFQAFCHCAGAGGGFGLGEG